MYQIIKSIYALLHKMLLFCQCSHFCCFFWMSHNTPGRQLKAEDVLDLRQHVLVHFVR